MLKIIGLTTSYLSMVMYSAGFFGTVAAIVAVFGVMVALPGLMSSAGKVISGRM